MQGLIEKIKPFFKFNQTAKEAQRMADIKKPTDEKPTLNNEATSLENLCNELNKGKRSEHERHQEVRSTNFGST